MADAKYIGDAPIRYATVSMFFDVEREAEEYCEMSFWHNGIHGIILVSVAATFRMILLFDISMLT